MMIIDIREKRKEKKEKIEEIKMKRTKETINLNHVAIRKNDHTTRDDAGSPANSANHYTYFCLDKRMESDASIGETGFKREKDALSLVTDVLDVTWFRHRFGRKHLETHTMQKELYSI